MSARDRKHSSRVGVRTPTDPSYLRDLFNNSARYYDSVNKTTSLGQVAGWRKEVVWAASLHPNDRVLDAFSGPGGLSAEAATQLGSGGRLVLADLSPVMLHEARKRLGPVLARRGANRPRTEYIAGDLLRDDLGLGEFDVVFLGWGAALRGRCRRRSRPHAIVRKAGGLSGGPRVHPPASRELGHARPSVLSLPSAPDRILAGR